MLKLQNVFQSLTFLRRFYATYYLYYLFFSLEEGISGYVKGQAIGVSFLFLLFFINGLWNKRIFLNIQY